MDEQKKPFDTVSIVLLMLLALGNDGAEILFDLLAMTGVGIAGEAIMQPLNFAVTCIVVPWFFIKTGSFTSVSSLGTILDSFLTQVGIPGRSIVVAAGIYVANHPESFVSKTSDAVLLKRRLAMESENKKVAQENATREQARIAERKKFLAGGSLGQTSQTEQGTDVTRGKEEVGEGVAGGEKKKTEEEAAERKMEMGAEIPPEEAAQEEIFEEIPKAKTEENKAAGSEAPPSEKKSPKVVSIDKAEEVKESLEHPRSPHGVTPEDTAGQSSNVLPSKEKEPGENNRLDKAA